ncbi:MAG: hypothetical protein UY63_C0001G0039 [Parcubacteria group bacterium GW2011_GWA2_51_10]|nr:MAG: hypothetical protein UY63_C0001G0039 [Parcubacteria group bacterium GW2011_GWA2_51_10]
MVKKAPKNIVLETLLSLDKQVRDISKDMATKDYVKATVDDVVDKAKKEILTELRAVTKAVDKDAVTIIDHGKRIVKLERHPVLQ